MPNREFAKKMNMGLAKELLFNVAARKIEKEAKKRNQNYHFIFVQANGQQLKEAAKILEKNQIHPLIGNQYSLTGSQCRLGRCCAKKKSWESNYQFLENRFRELKKSHVSY